MSEKGINQRMWHRVGRSGKVLTLLGGGFVDLKLLKQCLKEIPHLIAADGGADEALKLGIKPALIIGDLDSVSQQAKEQLGPEKLLFVDDQNSTDFEKCLQNVEADLILGFGFLGGRLDHELAALNALVKFPHQTCILIGEEDICFLAPSDLKLDLREGTRVSLFPMAQAQGTSTGLRYPIDGLDMSPAATIGTSNMATGPVELIFEQRTMLVILPLDCLALAADALIGV